MPIYPTEATSLMIPCDHYGNPHSYVVGRNGVTKITRETENFGDHGVEWMLVHEGDTVAVSIPSKQVAFIEWVKT